MISIAYLIENLENGILRTMHFSSSHLQKKAKRWAHILGCLSGVQAIFLSGSIAQEQGKPDSDIDFFIITRAGKIWTARFFIFAVLKLCGQLAKPKHHAGKICPNHFITDRHLEIQEKDAYAANLFTHNMPLYDPDGIWSYFIAANQKWVNKFGESFAPTSPPLDKEGLGEIKNSPLENLLKKIQTWKIRKNPDFKISNAKIILTDTELRFHPIPKNLTFKNS